ncbi:ROK family protein [Roseateles sp. BYS180W]|uniref:ROK family protein n=1 Tax=Roseateles rivi TaxID=3299028 RepID=A0ABW7FV32_9BURK
MTHHTLLGMDVGGSKVELVAYACLPDINAPRQPRMTALFRKRIPTPHADLDEFVQAMVQLVQEAEAQLDQQGCALGIGLPGVRDPNSELQRCANLPGLNGQPVREALVQALGRSGPLRRPMVFGNDCQCFALSEALSGAAASAPSMVGIILGTGAGAGICHHGRLHSGAHAMAGEWGHTSLPARLVERYQLPTLTCGCGLSGCMETLVSGPGIQRLHRHLGGAGWSASDIATASLNGDATAKTTLDCFIDLLAYGLAQWTLMVAPDAIVLGGGLSKLKLLYEALPQAMRTHLFPETCPPQVLPPRFGDAGGTRGAALLALNP